MEKLNAAQSAKILMSMEPISEMDRKRIVELISDKIDQYYELQGEFIKLRDQLLKFNWLCVDSCMPAMGQKNGVAELRPVLVTDGKDVFRAVYVPERSISTDDLSFEGDTDFYEATDKEYWPEGWYEWNEAEETHWSLGLKITHWMSLPPLPAKEAQP
jgi:hypothetical protein